MLRLSDKWQIRRDVEYGRDNAGRFPGQIALLRYPRWHPLVDVPGARTEVEKKPGEREAQAEKVLGTTVESLRFFPLTFWGKQDERAPAFLSLKFHWKKDWKKVVLLFLTNLSKAVARERWPTDYANQYTNVVYVIDEGMATKIKI